MLATRFFYSAYQFAIVRFFTGIGLFFYFITRKPYAPDFNSYDGLILKLSYLGIPNLLTYLPSTSATKIVLLGFSFLSILLAFGAIRRIAAIILSCGYIFSIGGIPLSPEPFSGYAMSLFLILLLAPGGEALKLFRPAPPFSWKLPQWQYWLVYISILFGYLVTLYQTKACTLGFTPRELNFSFETFITFGGLTLLHLGIIFQRIRPYAWVLLVFATLLILSISASNALLLIALLIFLLPSNTRFPWQATPSEEVIGTVFIDGECVICDEFATTVLEEDVWKNFQIATIQGKTGQAELPEELRKELNTVALKVGDQIYTHSTAVLEILKRLPGLWAFALLDQCLIPRFIRDNFYRSFAKYRYKIFGKKEVCSLPPAEGKDRLLD